MKAMLLAYEAPGDFARRNPAEMEAYMAPWIAYTAEMRQAGVNRGGAPLLGPETATVLSVRDRRRTVEDGPFADTKEQLGGYFILEVADLDEASRWAANCPAAKNGYVEVRTIPDYGQGE